MAPQQTPRYLTPSAYASRELRYLEPIAVEGIERERERHLAWQAVAARVAQRHESRLLFGRAIGHGKRRDMALHRSADMAGERKHRRGPTIAVEPDDVGAGILQPLARVGERPALTGNGLAPNRQRRDDGQAHLFDDLDRDQRLLRP